MRFPLLLGASGLVCCAASGQVGPVDHLTTAADLLRMHQGGLRDDTILAFLQAYRAQLQVTEADFQALAQAGLRPETIQALRLQAQAARRSGDALEIPLPRFFVGYPHDASAFPAWYFAPFIGQSATMSQHPGRNIASTGHRAIAAWRSGRRF